MASAFNGERPNPRLQRTPLRAPLSRELLGGSSDTGGKKTVRWNCVHT
jgi:hypothetical protein